ncbi:MAG: Plug domain-containing protein, partial [Pseudomonadota bacterium]
MNHTPLSRILGTTGILLVSLATATSADTRNSQLVDVPEQDLLAAIEELSTQTGLPIAVNRDAIGSKSSHAVQGPMTPLQALQAMVSDDALLVRQLNDDSLVVTRNLSAELVDQDAVGEDFELPPIIVRGELLERDLQDNQSSVVVATGEDLEQRGETQVDGLLRRIPGVDPSGRLTIRGITDDGGLGNLTSSSTISVTTDGIRLSDFRNGLGAGSISTWDVEQVEVFRGSQSTQTGRNALAGAVTVEGTRPQFDHEYRLRLGATRDLDFEDADPGYLAS